MTHIAFIGGGNMTRSLVGGLLKSGTAPSNIRVAEPQAKVREALSRDLGVVSFTDNAQAIDSAEVVVLAVKPQVLPTVCKNLSGVFQHQQVLIISIAAGISLRQLQCWLGNHLSIVRCMPNTPALLGAGATGLCANAQVSSAQRTLAQEILDAIGLTCWIDDETLMDTVTGLSGSGPAYFFALVEALIDAAIAQGLPDDIAQALAAQTCLGAGRMLVESGESPSQLRRRVTSPGGATQAALGMFTVHELPRIVALAVTAASHRAAELASMLHQDPSS